MLQILIVLGYITGAIVWIGGFVLAVGCTVGGFLAIEESEDSEFDLPAIIKYLLCIAAALLISAVLTISLWMVLSITLPFVLGLGLGWISIMVFQTMMSFMALMESINAIPVIIVNILISAVIISLMILPYAHHIH